MQSATDTSDAFPRLTPLGIDGLLVTFADRLDEAANRAALAFRSAVDDEGWEGMIETATSLASTFIAFDPARLNRETLAERLRKLLGTRDWFAADLPTGRRRLTIPVSFEGDHAPQLDEAADLAGLTRAQAIEEICARPVRALALGYAPGQAYLGELDAHWNIDRQRDLTPRVETGALVTAVRQLIVFATTTPTGWRQIGMTRFHGFRPDDPDRPIVLAPGDEVRFTPVSAAELEALCAPEGGVTLEDIA
ncbi:Allophanate hydrolase subunit 1 [Palleronia marisminoris]|uniref:Kinase A inhibitor n=1 Tax=Palleronia marisminoris TaxID=315423 RepID=A0A1Y5RVV6_9RHOB|nr:carboxyltransferase domain-containing protein [Palleronia marisminoris]SFG44767.1 Allophanate hydrolase subunit 1 [Palleronia marisminoris]SLN26474.1 Kinase A inhibitor [Palleronia marisminoris]